jgi:hypothetical protein
MSARADQSSLIYNGPTQFVHGRVTLLRAGLADTTTGQPITAATLQFGLGAATTTGTVASDGFASSSLTVSDSTGNVSLTITYAGDGVHAPASLTLPATIAPQPSAIFIVTAPYWPTGEGNALSATLVDADFGSPIISKLLSFSLIGSSVNAISDGSGIASTVMSLPVTTATGSADLAVTFAGDSDVLPSTAVQNGDLFQPTSFVIWGGNPLGVIAGQRVVFFANDWSKQVIAGDYNGGNFKGYAPISDSRLATCVDFCWAEGPGNLAEPEPRTFISVFVSKRIDRVRNTVLGTTDRIAIVVVDPVVVVNGRAVRRTGRVVGFLRGSDQPE